jgi:hypothetical protein
VGGNNADLVAEAAQGEAGGRERRLWQQPGSLSREQAHLLKLSAALQAAGNVRYDGRALGAG